MIFYGKLMNMKLNKLLLLPVLVLTGCVSISKEPSGSIFSSIPNMNSEEDLQFYEGSGDQIDESGQSYTINLKNDYYATTSISDVSFFANIMVDENNIINNISSFELAYASRNALMLDWKGSKKGFVCFNLTSGIRYVKILASPFYSTIYNYDTQKEEFVCFDSGIAINDTNYVKLTSEPQKNNQTAPIISSATYDLKNPVKEITLKTGLYASLIYQIILYA